MKKILITGASGWLGINLIKAFLNGIDLYNETQNLSDKTSINIFIPKSEHDKLYSLFGDKINYYYGDIRNKNECENFTKNFKTGTIFHLVGIIHPKRISELYEINYKGTKNICEASINAGLEKIIILSSNSPFGLNIDQNSPFHENSL